MSKNDADIDKLTNQISKKIVKTKENKVNDSEGMIITKNIINTNKNDENNKSDKNKNDENNKSDKTVKLSKSKISENNKKYRDNKKQKEINAFYLQAIARNMKYDVGRTKRIKHKTEQERLDAKKESFKKYMSKKGNMKKIVKIFDLFGSLTISGQVEVFVRLLQFFSSSELDKMQYII